MVYSKLVLKFFYVSSNILAPTLMMISKQQKNNKYSKSENIFDSIIASFRDMCKVSNVTVTYFKKGITYI